MGSAKHECLEKEMIHQQLRREVLEYGITIPPLECSFPWKIHLHAKQLEEECNAWVVDRFSHPAFRVDFLKTCGYGVLASLVYPDGMLTRMRPVVKFTAWLFMLDNIVDDPMGTGSDLAVAKQLEDKIRKVFMHGEQRQEEEDEEEEGKEMVAMALVETAREWWDEMGHAGMSRRQQQRFVRKMMDYIEAQRVFVEGRVGWQGSSFVVDVERYKEVRPRVGGWHACAALMDFVVGEEVEEELLCHPLLESLERAACNHICWANDLISLRKEVRDGNLMNLVPIMYMQQHSQLLTVQGVVQKICEMVRDCDAECVSLMAQIRGSLSSNALEAYLKGLAHWLSGSLSWHLTGPRYL